MPTLFFFFLIFFFFFGPQHQMKRPPRTPTTTTLHTDSFEDVYLQQITLEFADDIDKIRQASDFKGEKSLAVLVAALKQGANIYTEEERRDWDGHSTTDKKIYSS